MSANPLNIGVDDTTVDTWFERDRAYVILYEKAADGGFGDAIAEWWDDAVRQAVEDGFLDPRDYRASAFEYAESHGLLDPANRTKGEPAPSAWVIAHDNNGVLMTWRGGEMVWSATAAEADLERGATAFSDEATAREWFDDESEAFQEALSFHEAAPDVTVEGRSTPSRVSLKAMGEAGVDVRRAVPVPGA